VLIALWIATVSFVIPSPLAPWSLTFQKMCRPADDPVMLHLLVSICCGCLNGSFGNICVRDGKDRRSEETEEEQKFFHRRCDGQLLSLREDRWSCLSSCCGDDEVRYISATVSPPSSNFQTRHVYQPDCRYLTSACCK